MTLVTIVIIAFMVLEFSNVIALYFSPEFKFANAVGVFNAWKKSKEMPDMHMFVKYLVRWVAGTKLIFILLFVVILVFGGSQAQLYSMLALAVSTLTFYFALFPLIRKMDKRTQITPKGYSIILALMIFVIIGAFTTAFVLSLLGIVPY